WTRYFYDGAGRITKEVRFRYQDPASGQFPDQIVDPGERPTLAQLIANYDAAVQLNDPAQGRDYIRVVERTYDAAGNKLSESSISDTYGTVTNEWRYDLYNNKLTEIDAKGIADRELRTDYTYDAFNRAVTVTTGQFQYFDSQGGGHFGGV